MTTFMVLRASFKVEVKPLERPLELFEFVTMRCPSP